MPFVFSSPPIFALLLPLLFSSSAFALPETNASNSLRFEPFRPSEPYRCGAFAEQSSQTDPAMRMLQRAQNALIRALSRPFPHQKLLSDDALAGNTDAWRQSFIERRDQWLDFEFWWLVGALLLLLVPPLFALLFLLYRCVLCCCCCCCRDAGEKARRTDRRFDGARRVAMNALLGVMVVANIFCAAILLINTQYAQHGLDELPTRLHYCANDVTIYRSETVERIRKLLRDDFFVLNGSLYKALDGAGEQVVDKLKRRTGADLIEEVVAKANNAGPLQRRFEELSRELPMVLDARHKLQIHLLRLRQARDGLRECERNARDGTKAARCHQARQSIRPVLELAESEEEKNDNWENEERPREVSALLSEEIPPALKQIETLDLDAKFAPATEVMVLLQRGIQAEVDTHRSDADERLQALDRTLRSLHDQITTAIKGVDLSFLDEQLVDPMMRQREQYRQIVHVGWIGALAVSGMFAFLALAFLLGLCYGCCGRRPDEYEDDCCVRSTGTSFFACSIWLSVLLMTLFGILSAVAMLAGANTAHLVCHPLEEPLRRPDMLSLLDRLVSLYGLDRPSSPSSSDRFSLDQIFTAQRRPADLIRQCAQGQTLYTMFGFDKKFKLVGKPDGLQEDYDYLDRSIRANLASNKLIDQALSHSAGASNNRQWQFFSGQLRAALERMGQVRIPQGNATEMKEFCAQRTRFQLEGVVAELRRLQEQNTEAEAPEDKAEEGGEIAELVHFLEEQRPNTVKVRAQLEGVCARLQQFQRDLDSLRFNVSDLLVHLDRAERELGTVDKLREQMHAVAQEVATDVVERVRTYRRHINTSMATEVSSCAPLADIARHTRSALCDYALDPLNSLWLAMAIGLCLLLPIILLASALNPLYRHTYPYTKYSVPSTDYSPNEATFATDIYGLVGQQSANSRNTARKGATATTISQPLITSPYATSNYGYQELYPPAYPGTGRR